MINASYQQLGVEPGASMRDIEASYWRIAGELKGQAAMAPYTKAYETLVNSVRPSANAAPEAPDAASDIAAESEPPPERPPSKFGWPSN
jgi:hypothetical protein